MSYGAGMDDCVLILHMDRKDHIFMNYAQQIDRLPIFEQEAVALFVSKGSFFPTITMKVSRKYDAFFISPKIGAISFSLASSPLV